MSEATLEFEITGKQILFPPLGHKRWTLETMLKIWAKLEAGWTEQQLATAMGITLVTLRLHLSHYSESRRKELQDRALRPEHWAQVDAQKARADQRRRKQQALEQAALDAERRAAHAAWLETQPKRADGTVQLWKVEAIR